MAVRLEKVVLDLEDKMSRGLLTNAAAAKVLAKSLNDLDGQNVRTTRSTSGLNDPVERLSVSAVKADRGINQLTGRLRLMADVAATLGPALVPLGGVGLAGMAGLSAQLGFAGVAAGVLIGSFSGLGDVLKAMNKAELEPTAENMGKLSAELKGLSPQSAAFAEQIHNLIPALKALRTVGRDSIIGGFGDISSDLETLLPKIAEIMESVGGAMGELIGGGVGSLASDRWGPFLSFIRDEAPPALRDMAAIVGDVAHGMGEMWMTFDPLNDDFSSWMVDVADGFDKWAVGLAKTEGFAEFVDYIQTNGPRVADALGAIVNMFLQIVEAAAPVGAVILPALEAVADAVAAIADSDLGTPILAGVAALSLLNRALAVTKIESAGGLFGGISAVGSSAKAGFAGVRADVAAVSDNLVAFGGNADKAAAASGRLKGQLASVGKSAALVGGLAVAGTGAADGIGLTNSASLALMGTMISPGWGTALGGAAGLLLDNRQAASDFAGELERLNAAAAGNNIEVLNSNIESTQKSLAKAKADLADVSKTSGVGDFFGDFAIAGASADITGDLEKKIRSYEAALRDAKGPQKELTAAQEQAARSTAYRDTLQAQADQIMYNVEAMRTLREETINSGNAELGYKSAILDTKDAVKENGVVLKRNGDLMNENSRAAIESKGKLYDLASAWNAQSSSQKDAAGAARLAKKGFIDAAVGMGMGEEAARRLARQLFEIPTRVKTKVEVETGYAKNALSSLKEQLDALHDKNITVRVTQQGNAVSSPGYGPQNPNPAGADGMTVPGKRAPYGDKIFSYLAPGEEVISNRYGQADRHRELLKRINANSFANGGTAGNFFGMHAPRAAVSTEERLAVLQAEKQIRELIKSLKADGKDRLKGRGRQIAELELQAARESLAAAKADRGGAAREAANTKQEEAAQKQADAAELLAASAKDQQDAAKSLYESVKQQRESFEASVSSNFLGGGLDLTSLGAFDKSSAKQGASSAAWEQTIAALTAAGLDGELLKEVAASGSLKFANQLLATGPAGIDQREQMYAQSHASADAGASTAGVAAYGRAEVDAWNAMVASAASTDQLVAASETANNLLVQLTKVTAAAGKVAGVEFSGAINKTATHSGRNKKPKIGRP